MLQIQMWLQVYTQSGTPSRSRTQEVHQESVSMQQADTATEFQDLHDNYQVVRFHWTSLLEYYLEQQSSKSSINNISAARKPNIEPLPLILIWEAKVHRDTPKVQRARQTCFRLNACQDQSRSRRLYAST